MSDKAQTLHLETRKERKKEGKTREGKENNSAKQKKDKDLISKFQKPKAWTFLMVQSDTTGLKLQLKAGSCQTTLTIWQVGGRIQDRRRKTTVGWERGKTTTRAEGGRLQPQRLVTMDPFVMAALWNRWRQTIKIPVSSAPNTSSRAVWGRNWLFWESIRGQEVYKSLHHILSIQLPLIVLFCGPCIYYPLWRIGPKNLLGSARMMKAHQKLNLCSTCSGVQFSGTILTYSSDICLQAHRGCDNSGSLEARITITITIWHGAM